MAPHIPDALRLPENVLPVCERTKSTPAVHPTHDSLMTIASQITPMRFIDAEPRGIFPELVSIEIDDIHASVSIPKNHWPRRVLPATFHLKKCGWQSHGVREHPIGIQELKGLLAIGNENVPFPILFFMSHSQTHRVRNLMGPTASKRQW
jgi:hypothetical protein